MGAEANLKAKGIELPAPPEPSANYVRYLMVGNQLWISGTGPGGGPVSYRGKVGKDIDMDAAYLSARQCGLNILSTIRDALGSLDRVTQVVKVLGMVNAHEIFTEHPKVINGCTDLFNEVFDDKGVPTRSAVGMSSLPNNISTEVECMVLFE